MERGGARLFLNGKEEYPLLAVSSSLLHTAPSYRKAGIRFLNPLIGLEDGWTGPGTYDWERFDKYFAKLLELVPDAFILPRIHPYTAASLAMLLQYIAVLLQSSQEHDVHQW